MAENTPAVEQHDNKMVRFEQSQFNNDLESNINDNQDQVHVTQTATQQTNLDTTRKNRSDQSVISSVDNNILTMSLSQFWYKKKHGMTPTETPVATTEQVQQQLQIIYQNRG